MTKAMDDYRYLVYTDKPNQIYNDSDGGTVEPATETPAMDGTAAVGSSAKYAREDHVHPTDTSRAASSHTHGSITNAGAITSDTAVASGDKLIIADSSDSSQLKRSDISFGSYTNKFLANNGTWQTPPGNSWSDISQYFSTDDNDSEIKALTDGKIVYLTIFNASGFSSASVSLSSYMPTRWAIGSAISDNNETTSVYIEEGMSDIYSTDGLLIKACTLVYTIAL